MATSQVLHVELNNLFSMRIAKATGVIVNSAHSRADLARARDCVIITYKPTCRFRPPANIIAPMYDRINTVRREKKEEKKKKRHAGGGGGGVGGGGREETLCSHEANTKFFNAYYICQATCGLHTSATCHLIGYQDFTFFRNGIYIY